MKSPITSKVMPVLNKKADLYFRKEAFTINFHYYYCEDSDEEFTDDKLDGINQTQVYNMYREKYGIPFPDEISSIREQYGLSSTKMSLVLGLGSNAYRLYEAGEMPSVANGRLVLSVKQPEAFIRQIEASSHLLTGKEQQKLTDRARKLQEEQKHDQWNNLLYRHIFGDPCPSEFNGYQTPRLDKIAALISFFSPKIDLYKTKMNKILFYCDFVMFKSTAHSMTGIAYRAIPYGPVPVEYDKLYMKLCDDGSISIVPKLLKDGNYGEIIQSEANGTYTFTDVEQQVLNKVLNKFKGKTTQQIVDISHEELGWLENENNKGIISYQKYAFNLKAI
ncbi:type II toxin-antitoxin system antitoxin SocA domain-containing protein [Pedobacter faecalis]|uniref:type II toxin-antitoxin system antitoxin SocA domain-containing protein n=1 Tax=Pedobacter faecalis TaxID=3041495 RepID=UPI00254BFD82|nr:type II toxin-antitoxin system antitoxin SocA domain-containing protein [Pedobacter sp. ELA7]